MTPRLVSRLLSAISVIAFSILGLGSFLWGITLDGWNAPEIQCSYALERPAAGGPYYERTRIQGDYTFLPLGMDCSYDAPDDDVGPQEVSHPNWLATIIAAFSLLMAARSAVLVVKPEAFGRH